MTTSDLILKQTKADTRKSYYERNKESLREKGKIYRDRVRDTRNAKKRAAYQKDKQANPEYTAWRTMIQRCHNPNHQRYERYGACGITVCERWRLSFEAFISDMGPRPTPTHQIDRKENSKGYEPGNCRWVTPTQQQRNRRSNHLVTHDGRTCTLTEWSEITGIHKDTIGWRVKHGWTPAEALGLAASPRRKEKK